MKAMSKKIGILVLSLYIILNMLPLQMFAQALAVENDGSPEITIPEESSDVNDGDVADENNTIQENISNTDVDVSNENEVTPEDDVAVNPTQESEQIEQQMWESEQAQGDYADFPEESERERRRSVWFPAPKNARFDGKTERWDSVDGADKYYIRVWSEHCAYPNCGELVSEYVPMSTTSYPLDDFIKEPRYAHFNFLVKALVESQASCENPYR